MKKILYMGIVVCIAFLTLVNCGRASGYERGILTETGFESKYLDIRFTLPEGFIMATEEDMRLMMGIGADITGANTNFVNMTTVYEMMASAPVGLPNVILMVERLILSNITTEQYFDILKNNLSDIDTIDYEFGDQITSVEIAGQIYKQLSASIPGWDVFQNYTFRRQGNRMVGFITTYSLDTKEELEILMNGFSRLTF
ncbi:MAG: hypothetical protein FWC97_08195 [Treponema sp.]|nr:hypothetical protein [Treponema sp.]